MKESGLETSEDCLETSEDCLETSEDCLETSEDCLETSEDCLETSDDSVEMSDDSVETSDDSVEMSETEYSELVLSAYQLIYDTIYHSPLVYTKPDCYNIVTSIVYETLRTQLHDIKDVLVTNCQYEDHKEETEKALDTVLNKIIQKGFYMYYLNHAPPRESGKTFTKGSVDVDKMSERIQYLESVPQPDQRTDEWYHFRHKYLTASSLWKVFSTESSRNNLIYSKCAPLNTAKYKSCCIDSPMHWGNKYEPVSIQWYEHTYRTSVSDFGCIPHEDIEYIAASPDGINTLPSSERYGRMLEVKNIVNREITGIPKTEYWIQMQIQMEVCKLEECDFLETRFIEYESREAFYHDGSFTKSNDNKLKGIIMHFAGENNMPIYEYPPLFQTEEEFELWEEKMMEKYKNLTWIQNLYWKLAEISCVLVLRNTLWFDAVLPELNNFWSIIQKEKLEGYEHRAPKRRQKSSTTSPQITPLKCNIDIAKLLEQEAATCFNNNNNKHGKQIVLNIATETIKNTEI